MDRWIADRALGIEMSGVRKVFELGRSLKDPVNLSIGQPHFPVPEPIRAAAKAAIDAGHNGYTVTQGIPELRAEIKAWLDHSYGHADREVILTSGTSGALVLALLATVNPGDEVILFDPYFVGYPAMVALAGGTPVVIDTYPDFTLDVDRVAAAMTPRTKAILFNAPANPSGVVPPASAIRDLARLADRRGVLLVSDEIYRSFSYDEPFTSPAAYNQKTLVVDGFGKTYGVTGWRLGYAHGPRVLVEQMSKLQQFTFVCPPTPAQHAGVAAWGHDVSAIVADYRRKRDRLVAGLRRQFEFVIPKGAFYLFPKVPRGTGTEFVTEAVRLNLLIIPGVTFSRRDSHFRVSYAADDAVLERGIDILNKLSER
ncbi:MAG TPA: aminotransferase class I/II-fold pyridoxal phosphate-dependent enzyme [Gemmataceae bacterium]|jgi:aspartate aminotransferase/aminotransferase